MSLNDSIVQLGSTWEVGEGEGGGGGRGEEERG